MTFVRWIGSATPDEIAIAEKLIEEAKAEHQDRVAGSVVPRVTRAIKRGRPRAKDGLRTLAREALVALGSPTDYRQIAKSIRERRGATVNLESLRSGLRRMAKTGDTFSVFEDGRYGLLEWMERAKPSQGDDSAPAEDGSRRFAGVA